MTDDAGEPIEGIFVTVWTPSPVDGHPEIAGDTETAADGTYSIDGLRSGDYRVQFESDGDYANEYYDNELTIDHATVLDVDTGEVVEGIDAQLIDAAHLTGTVTGVGGELCRSPRWLPTPGTTGTGTTSASPSPTTQTTATTTSAASAPARTVSSSSPSASRTTRGTPSGSTPTSTGTTSPRSSWPRTS